MLLKAKTLANVPRRFVQALFVSPRNAEGNPPALVQSFDYKRLKNRPKLEEIIKRRGLCNKIDINHLYSQWELYKIKKSQKELIEKRMTQLTTNIEKIRSVKSPSAEDQVNITNFQCESRALRNEYKDACTGFYEIEEQFNNSFLTLPNKLLENTPDEPRIAHSSEVQPADTAASRHHIHNEKFVEFINQWFFYLRSDAATFDLNFPLKCLDYFQQNGFVQFRNPDFARTIVIEGAGLPIENVFEIPHSFHENYSNLVHLVGCGHWLSFLGYIAKIKADKSMTPTQFVSTGKMYQPISENHLGLFGTAQSTTVQVFLTGTEQQMNQKFDETLDLIVQIYKMFGIHFRVVHVPATELQSAECFGTRIEMFSPHHKKYIEIGNLSHYADYISKRLKFRFEKAEKNPNYKPHIVSGTVCNVTRLIGIILETHGGIMPKSILDENFVKLLNK